MSDMSDYIPESEFAAAGQEKKQADRAELDLVREQIELAYDELPAAKATGMGLSQAIRAEKGRTEAVQRQLNDLRAAAEPGRWWRVVASDGSLWCETSDEQEARSALRPGDHIEREFVTPAVREWREQPDSDLETKNT